MICLVIRNLLSNAIKFTSEDGQIIVENYTDSDNIYIKISDNGIGMHTEQIAKLFKNDSLTSTKGTLGEKGTGLGLLLCKDFISLHKRNIWVDNLC